MPIPTLDVSQESKVDQDKSKSDRTPSISTSSVPVSVSTTSGTSGQLSSTTTTTTGVEAKNGKEASETKTDPKKGSVFNESNKGVMSTLNKNGNSGPSETTTNKLSSSEKRTTFSATTTTTDSSSTTTTTGATPISTKATVTTSSSTSTVKCDSKRKEVDESNLSNLGTNECETSQSSKGRKSSRKGSKKKEQQQRLQSQNGNNNGQSGTLSEQQTNHKELGLVSSSGGGGALIEAGSPREELQELDNNSENKEGSGTGVDGTVTGTTTTANNKGAHDRNSNKSCCFCWCCCCSCSCLSVKNQGKGKENNKQQQLSPLEHYFNGNGEAQPTLEEIRTWGESFDKLMKCPWGRKVFRDFLKCEYSEENILFWLACEDLKNETNPEVIEEKARLIYEDYISILSPKEVSLDSRVREIINKNMVEPTASTFDEAQLQIYTLMHRDSYPRFINSPMYRKLAQLPSPTRKGSTA